MQFFPAVHDEGPAVLGTEQSDQGAAGNVHERGLSVSVLL